MPRQTYSAAVLSAPAEISLEPRPASGPAKNEIVIEVAYAGVCGTDLAIYGGEYAVPLPLVPGHEFTGYVTRVGSEVGANLLGKLVSAEINNTCVSYGRPEKCPACRRGLPNHCTQRTVLGIKGCDGAFAELVQVPFRNVHVVPDGVSDREGVFVEPLAAAICTFELSPVGERDVVVVLGTGRLGTLLCAVARERGAKVIAVDVKESALKTATSFGANHAFLGTADKAAEEVRRLTDGLGADMVIDATGRARGLTDALSLVRPRGTVALKTTCGLPSLPIDATRIAVNEIAIQGSRCGPFDKALEMIANRRIDVTPLISSVFHLYDIREAMEAAKSETKVLIEVG